MDGLWTFPNFKRTAAEPILTPDPDARFDCPVAERDLPWRCGAAFNPAATAKDGKIYLLFRAEDGFGDGLGRYTSRIGLAESCDGLNFTVRPKPVLFPAEDEFKTYEWPGGCEDPRVVSTPDGAFLMTYTAWDGRVARLSSATSTDLERWTKHGPVFANAGGNWIDAWSKAGSVVTELIDGRLVAAEISGKYWMYWGEGRIHAATSTDLKNWMPVVNEEGHPVEALRPRMCMFDSELVEAGAVALLTRQGIVLMYNAKNDGTMGDPSLVGGAYCPAQALFDAEDPCKLLDRTGYPFLRPEASFESSGQYLPGTVFVEGLVPAKGKWLLYYGCADSVAAVAEAPRK